MTGQAEAYGDEPPEYRFHAGELVAADVGLGVPRELLVHGWDLAKTMDRSWPVTRLQVPLIWPGVEPVLPGSAEPARSAGHQAADQVHPGEGMAGRPRDEDANLACKREQQGTAEARSFSASGSTLITVRGRATAVTRTRSRRYGRPLG